MPSPDEGILKRKDQIIAQLRAVLPGEGIIDDENETRAYECDALTAYHCPPLAVALPGTTREVSEILGICDRESVPVVPGDRERRSREGPCRHPTAWSSGCPG